MNADGRSRGRAKVTEYHRLVRDRIPEMIESMGNIVVCHELDDESFDRALLDTVARAAQQFAEGGNLESLADVLDALHAWLDLRGLTMEDVDKARIERRKRCGGYARRLYLEMVAEGDNPDTLARPPRC